MKRKERFFCEKEQEEHIEKTYKEKADNNIKICLIICTLSMITYIIPIFLENFDFGIIFEVLAVIFIILGKIQLGKDNYNNAKQFIALAMIPVLSMILYDLVELITHWEEVLYTVGEYFITMSGMFFSIEPYLFDPFLVIIFVLLLKIYESISRADGTDKTNDVQKNFYDRL